MAEISVLKIIKSWQRSISGKITQFLLIGIAASFTIGAFNSWNLIDGFFYQQWKQNADSNAQIITYIIRNIYSNTSITTNESGQITQIISEKPLGDDVSILVSGYNPVDALAIASLQTHDMTWLFLYTPEKGFVGIDNNSDQYNENISFTGHLPLDTLSSYYVGFAKIGNQEHFISAIPILTPSGKILGSLISSIGTKDELNTSYNKMLKKNIISFVLIFFVTLVLVTIFVRSLFRPIPILIKTITNISREETNCVIPYLDLDNEIGNLAVAIEILRVAMKERNYLQHQHEMSQKMEYIAHHDFLTALPNRLSFGLELDNRVSKYLEEGKQFNLLMIDLDNFKPVNDTFGHKAGDELLIRVAQRLQVLLEPDDIVARLGGDEFAVLQSVKNNATKEARYLSESIIQTLNTPFTWNGNNFSINCSIGIVTVPHHGNNALTLMINADLAMYASKHHGRGCFHFFEEGMIMKQAHNVFINQEIINGIGNEEFEIHYQPIVNLKDKSIYGYESLIRWNHPTKGLIYPESFIHIAENSGTISQLGEWVIGRSCETAAKWSETLNVSVNISACQIHSPGLVGVIKSALFNSQLSAERFEIEITESEKLVKDIALPVLEELRDLGINIAIDHLGSGYAALDYLLTYPFTRIKISKELTNKLGENNGSKYLIMMLIQFAEKFNIEITAVGVETVQQKNFLKDIGCKNAQGYFFSRPLCEQQVLSFFTNELTEEHQINA